MAPAKSCFAPPLWGILTCLVVLFLTLAPTVKAHASLVYPPFRGMAITSDAYLRSAFNGLAGFNAASDSVCGDGGQATAQGNLPWTFGKRGTPTVLKAGSTVTFSINMRVWHSGRFEFRICQYSGAETTSTLTQACLDKNILQPAPMSQQAYPNQFISQQPWFWVGSNTAVNLVYTMAYVIPSGLTCDGVNSFCVLQYAYVTGNSCNPSGNCQTTAPAMCKPPGWFQTCTITPPTGEIFRNCADISVKGGVPTNAPPRTVVASPPPSGGGSGCCSKFASGNHQNPANCNQYCVCTNYQVSYIMNCPAGLYFNENGGYCDWPSNVKCPY